MFIPTQGFRHAVALLVHQRCEAIAASAAAADDPINHLSELARDLVALARDMHVGPESSEWLRAEFERSLDHLPYRVDREAILQHAARIFEAMPSSRPEITPCDLFLVYVPEDRLPVAAPLAIDLVKRRVSVAFSQYEVSTAAEFDAALRHGLSHHRGGAVLWTAAFDRGKWDVRPPESDRIQVIRDYRDRDIAAHLAAWARRLKVRNITK